MSNYLPIRFRLIPLITAVHNVEIYPRYSSYVGAAILGGVFYTFYHLCIMHTFNELLLGRLVLPSLICSVYFELINKAFLITVTPTIICGFVGVTFQNKYVKSQNTFSLQ